MPRILCFLVNRPCRFDYHNNQFVFVITLMACVSTVVLAYPYHNPCQDMPCSHAYLQICNVQYQRNSAA